MVRVSRGDIHAAVPRSVFRRRRIYPRTLQPSPLNADQKDYNVSEPSGSCSILCGSILLRLQDPREITIPMVLQVLFMFNCV